MSGTVLDYSIELYQIGKEVVAEYAQNIIEEKCSAILPNEQLLLAEAVLLPNLAEYFGCVVNGYRESAKKHGFEEVWSELEPQFQFYLNKMKKCQSDTYVYKTSTIFFTLIMLWNRFITIFHSILNLAAKWKQELVYLDY